MAETQKKSPPGDRIAKVLARAGVASRREAERMVEAGRVSVNGKVITSPALNVIAKDRVVVDGKEVGDPEPPRLWLYHKPKGLVTTERDDQGRETVFDALPDDMPRVMSVGRLDLNSEGLLLLTNDVNESTFWIAMSETCGRAMRASPFLTFPSEAAAPFGAEQSHRPRVVIGIRGK